MRGMSPSAGRKGPQSFWEAKLCATCCSIQVIVPSGALSGGIVVEVSSIPSNAMPFTVPLTCGTILISGDPASPGTPVGVTFGAPGATSVTLVVIGANTNPTSSQVAASQTPNTSNWTASIDTTELLGAYQVTPVISNLTGPVICTVSRDFFNVVTPSPAPPGQAKCASMTGTWAESVQGEQTSSWSMTDNGGTISGSATQPSPCGGQRTWTVGGSYTASTQTYAITSTHGVPASQICNGILYTLNDETDSGSIQSGGYCGLASGTFIDTDPGSGATVYSGSNSFTVNERIPSGETTTFSAWADQYGAPTTAVFSVSLTGGSANYKFAGRNVTETDPTPQETPPQDVGSDGCWWPEAPWQPITSLAAHSMWFVQNNNSYGLDYVGLGTDQVAWIQAFSPALASSGSCTIQYPQKMVINSETVTNGVPDSYGGQNTGFNMIVIVVTPAGVSVSRGGGSSGSQSFHF